jgi:NTP pyrophosphatase (non-canonical NTP hydrolase)
MEINTYQLTVDDWIKTIGVRYFSELTNMAILSEEVGEVARLISRMYGEQSFKTPLTKEEQKEKLADELADVIWVITCLANQTGIDLEEAIRKNMDKKTNRDSQRHIQNKKLL